jgi:hypothetical protein
MAALRTSHADEAQRWRDEAAQAEIVASGLRAEMERLRAEVDSGAVAEKTLDKEPENPELEQETQAALTAEATTTPRQTVRRRRWFLALAAVAVAVLAVLIGGHISSSPARSTSPSSQLPQELMQEMPAVTAPEIETIAANIDAEQDVTPAAGRLAQPDPGDDPKSENSSEQAEREVFSEKALSAGDSKTALVAENAVASASNETVASEEVVPPSLLQQGQNLWRTGTRFMKRYWYVGVMSSVGILKLGG